MNKSFIYKKLPFTGITIGYMAILLILSAIPDTSLPENQFMLLSPTVQNLAHVPAYGVLALLWGFSLRNFGVPPLRAVLAAMTITFMYGVAIELVQAFVPGRYPSIQDCFLNASGILMSTACYLLISSQGSITWLGLESTRSKL